MHLKGAFVQQEQDAFIVGGLQASVTRTKKSTNPLR